MTTLQRRRWERYRKELDVIIEAGDGSPDIRCKTLDICEGGLGVVSTEQLSVGAEYRFVLPAITPKPMVGIVRWCTPSTSRGGNHIGVELTGVSSTQLEDLADAIARFKVEDAATLDA